MKHDIKIFLQLHATALGEEQHKNVKHQENSKLQHGVWLETELNLTVTERLAYKLKNTHNILAVLYLLHLWMNLMQQNIWKSSVKKHNLSSPCSHQTKPTFAVRLLPTAEHRSTPAHTMEQR